MRKLLFIIPLLVLLMVGRAVAATELDYMEYATDAAAQAAYVSNGIDPASWDLLNEPCNDFTTVITWTDGDTGTSVSQINPAGQFEFDTNADVGSYAIRNGDFGSTPNAFTVEIKTYLDVLGTHDNDDTLYFMISQTDETFLTKFCSDKLTVYDTGSGQTTVGTNLVKTGVDAEWQTWRYLITYTGTTGAGTCDVYLNDSTHQWEKVGTGIPCSYEVARTDGLIELSQHSYTTSDRISHIDYIKIATGLTVPALQSYSEATIKTQGSYSLKGIAAITDSLNKTLTRTVSPTIDLTGKSLWEFYIYSASRTGSNIKLGIKDSGGTSTETTPNVTSTGAWQKVSVDISAVADADKDAISEIKSTIVNADAANTFYIDNMYGEIAAPPSMQVIWIN